MNLIKRLNDSSIISIFMKCLIYTIILFGSMFIASNFMADTYTANIALFAIFAFCFELIINFNGKKGRFFSYIVTIVMLGLGTTLLIKESIDVSLKNKIRYNISNIVNDAGGIVICMDNNFTVTSYSHEFNREFHSTQEFTNEKIINLLNKIKNELNEKNWQVYIGLHNINGKIYNLNIFAIKYFNERDNNQFVIVLTKE